jgi:hypothetical protein
MSSAIGLVPEFTKVELMDSKIWRFKSSNHTKMTKAPNAIIDVFNKHPNLII